MNKLPKTYDIVFNPKANSRESLVTLEHLKTYLNPKGVAYVVHQTKHPGHAADIVRRLLGDGRVNLVVMGGDGIIQDAIHGLEIITSGTPTHQSPALGIIPAGTGNDIAKMLGIPMDVHGAADVLLRGRTSLVDFALVNGKIRSMSFVGYGIASEVVRGMQATLVSAQNQRMLGKYRYLMGLMSKMLRFRASVYGFQWHGPEGRGEIEACKADFLSIHNCINAGGGMRLCDKARMDDGHLDLLVVQYHGKVRRILNLAAVMRGRLYTQPNVRIIPVYSAKIFTSDADCCVDGELVTLQGLELEIVPSGLCVIH